MGLSTKAMGAAGTLPKRQKALSHSKKKAGFIDAKRLSRVVEGMWYGLIVILEQTKFSDERISQ